MILIVSEILVDLRARQLWETPHDVVHARTIDRQLLGPRDVRHRNLCLGAGRAGFLLSAGTRYLWIC
jgi:hypothetical protein